jgi:hypothetical protein
MEREILGLYILDPEIGNGQVPIPCDDFLVWAEWMAIADRRVALDMVGTIRLSTIFIGLDHQFSEGPPLLFETMAFDESDQRTHTLSDLSATFSETVDWIWGRYSTWEDALWSHKEWLEKLQASVTTAGGIEDAPR